VKSTSPRTTHLELKSANQSPAEADDETHFLKNQIGTPTLSKHICTIEVIVVY